MTIMGQHTVDETQDLITVLNGRMFDLQNGLYKIVQDPSLVAKDPTLQADWGAYVTRWGAAIGNVQKELSLKSGAQPMVPNSVLAAEDSYQELLKAVNPQTPGPYTPKDLMGLQIRIQNLTAIPWVDRPLPADFDVDLQAYKEFDASPASQAAKFAQNKAQAAASTLGNALSENKGTIALAVIGVGAGILVARKLHIL